MKITENNIKDNIGEYKILSFVEQFISRGVVDSIDHAETLIQDFIRKHDGQFIHGHLMRDYIELESDWNFLEVWHLDSNANRDRLILKIEL